MYQQIIPGVTAYFFKAVSSTMDEARLLADTGSPGGTVVVAESQYSGRGRRGRAWTSLEGNLYMTYLTRPDCSVEMAANLSFVACVAIGEALRGLLKPSHTVTYKWPNDILINGKKVAGVLLETVSGPSGELEAVLIGCGANVLSYPDSTRYQVTSLFQEGSHVKILPLLTKICAHLQGSIAMWKAESFSIIRTRWLKHALGLNQHIIVQQGDQKISGIFKGIDANGALQLLDHKGSIQLVSAGDVAFGDVRTLVEKSAA